MVATKWTQEEVASRLVRYPDLRPCTTAFIDTHTPGSDQKENFTIIGPGVAENPDQYVHIDIPHGFNIGAARQPAGCVNSQHSHETAEVFVVHTGRWKFSFCSLPGVCVSINAVVQGRRSEYLTRRLATSSCVHFVATILVLPAHWI